jgi:hypothetical protein
MARTELSCLEGTGRLHSLLDQLGVVMEDRIASRGTGGSVRRRILIIIIIVITRWRRNQ